MSALAAGPSTGRLFSLKEASFPSWVARAVRGLPKGETGAAPLPLFNNTRVCFKLPHKEDQQ
jgi:hypothetical protein